MKSFTANSQQDFTTCPSGIQCYKFQFGRVPYFIASMTTTSLVLMAHMMLKLEEEEEQSPTYQYLFLLLQNVDQNEEEQPITEGPPPE